MGHFYVQEGLLMELSVCKYEYICILHLHLCQAEMLLVPRAAEGSPAAPQGNV